jgi:hypothetical protein
MRMPTSKPVAAVFLLFAVANFSLAKDKPKDSDYQPGVLISFRTQTNGSSCSGRVDGTVGESGQVDAGTRSSCSDRTVRLYTIQVGGQTFTVEPAYTGKQKARGFATLGWSTVFEKGSVLRNQLPGAQIEVRSDSSDLFIRVQNKESKFKIVEAH